MTMAKTPATMKCSRRPDTGENVNVSVDILQMPGGRTVASPPQGVRRGKSRQHRARCPAQAGAGVRKDAGRIGPQRRSLSASAGKVKRGNPHLLQPQAWPLTLLA